MQEGASGSGTSGHEGWIYAPMSRTSVSLRIGGREAEAPAWISYLYRRRMVGACNGHIISRCIPDYLPIGRRSEVRPRSACPADSRAAVAARLADEFAARPFRLRGIHRLI